MRAKQFADIQISLHYLTTCIERLQKGQAVSHPLSFQPDIANLLHACVESEKKFTVFYEKGELDIIVIHLDGIGGKQIQVHADGHAYTIDDNYRSVALTLLEVMAMIVGR